MKPGEQINALYDELDKVITRFHREFDMPVGAIVGTIEFLKLNLFREAVKNHEEDEE